MADNIWKMLLSEFVGTFTLVFVGASAVALTVQQGGSLLTSAFAFGLALMTIIYVWGSYSGAHVNPAVSFGFAVAGQMNWWLMLGYWVAQLLGGIAAAALVAYFFGTATGAGASVGSLTHTNAWKAVLMEAFLTFFLVIAYLFIYRNPMLAIISGVAIGLVLTFTFLAGGSLTGASTNPARSIGPAIFGSNAGTTWIYIVGPLLGALVAALVYKLFTVDFSCRNKVDECGECILDECGNPIKECCRPVVDNCGRPVKDCIQEYDECGEPCGERYVQKYETYTKHERKLGFMQETPLLRIGEWMSGHGMDPRYIKQELDHTVEKAMHNGVIENPKELIDGVLESAVGKSMPSKPTTQILIIEDQHSSHGPHHHSDHHHSDRHSDAHMDRHSEVHMDRHTELHLDRRSDIHVSRSDMQPSMNWSDMQPSMNRSDMKPSMNRNDMQPSMNRNDMQPTMRMSPQGFTSTLQPLGMQQLMSPPQVSPTLQQMGAQVYTQGVQIPNLASPLAL
jgi:MIP family channel proteins